MSNETILVVDDEMLIRWSLGQRLAKLGFRVREASCAAEAIHACAESEPDLLLLDQNLPDGTGIDILERLSSCRSPLPVIMLTAVDRSDVAVQAMKLGAFDYVTKPVDYEKLVIAIRRALEASRLKRQVAHFMRQQKKDSGFCGMNGKSAVMGAVFEAITTIAASDTTSVLIAGESGTGKELVAKAIHFLSPRREGPLVTVNCAAVAESLVASELFGHEKGAFTDARAQRQGVFELADGGTIFLDEIGDMPLSLQAKLLRVLESKTFRRVGGSEDITVDVRVISATNRPLAEHVAKGLFRQDLLYRLNVAEITLPPLRDRGEDVILLAEMFMTEFDTKFGKTFRELSRDALDGLRRYPWPGNVRELRNVLERAILLSDGEVLTADRLGLTGDKEPREEPDSVLPDDSLMEMEKRALALALAKSGNNQSEAARRLKISRDTLRYRMRKFGISPS